MRKQLVDKLFIMAFIVIIFVPSVGLLFKRDPIKVFQQFKRGPIGFPGFDIWHIRRTDFRGIEDWYADKILLVNTLSQLWSGFNYYLGISSKPEKTVAGKSGWLFLGNFYQATIDQYTGKNLPTQEEVDLTTNAFIQMNAVAKQNQVPFLVVVAPDKQDVYSEYLPIYIRKSQDENRLQLFAKALVEQKIDVLDLRKIELKAKDTLAKKYGDLYLKCDSHWNYLGAYAAYQSIVKKLKILDLPINNIKHHFLPATIDVGDLTIFLQLNSCVSNAPMPETKNLKVDLWGEDLSGMKKIEPFQFVPNFNGTNSPFQITNKAQTNRLTVLLIGDSFSEHLNFYFNIDFHKTVRVHYSNPKYNLANLIKTYHPDVVIFEMVERNLFHYDFAFDGTQIQAKTTA